MGNSEVNKYGLTLEKAENRERLNGRFRDFDELSEAVMGWDFDFVQLDAGAAPATLTQVASPGLVIQRFQFDRSYRQRGASPSGMRTFGLIEHEAPDIRMFGKTLTGSDFALFRTGGEFEAVSHPGFACLTFSINEELLEQAFETVELSRRGGTLAAGSGAGSGLYRVEPKFTQHLRRRAGQLLNVLEANPVMLGRTELWEELNVQLAIDLALAMRSADDAPQRAASHVRELALRRAIAYIDGSLDESITIRGLCAEVGVGWTTLVDVFREHFGLTPKAYLRAVRLNCVRKDLVKAAPETLIADIANRFDFWHMGQFAADYKRLYGELPSDTRSRMLPCKFGGSSALGLGLNC